MKLLGVTKIISFFLNLIYKAFNALGITSFNEKITDILAELA